MIGKGSVLIFAALGRKPPVWRIGEGAGAGRAGRIGRG